VIIDVHTHPFGNTSISLNEVIHSRRDVVILRRTAPDKFLSQWQDLKDETDELITDMDSHGITVAVIQPSVGEPGDAVTRALERHQGRLVGLCGSAADEFLDETTRPRDWKKFDSYIEEQKSKGIIGFGEFGVRAITDSDSPLEIAKSLYPMMEVLQRHSFSLQILTAWTQFGTPLLHGIPLFVDYLAEAFPDVKVALTKMGRGYDFIFETCLAVAYKHENVYLETADSRVHHVKRAVQELGADRVMFGSDWTGTWRVLHEDESLYEVELSLVRDADLGSEAESWVLGKTAAEFYNLGTLEGFDSL
jgi:predicted TIM-barrel fold metal-dependent hydrolase